MTFEVYKPNITKRDSLIISLQHSGKIGFNAAATRRLQEEAVQWVVSLWDVGKSTLGIRTTSKDERLSFPICFRSKYSHDARSVKGFLEHIQRKAYERQSIPTKWNASEKRFEVSLPVPSIDVARSSASRGQRKERSNKSDP